MKLFFFFAILCFCAFALINGGSFCASYRDCQPGDRCLNNECVDGSILPDAQRCKNSNECKHGYWCKTNYCVAS